MSDLRGSNECEVNVTAFFGDALVELGPKDQRVLILSNMKGTIPVLGAALEMVTDKYTEQVTWRDTTTGRCLQNGTSSSRSRSIR